MSRFEKKPLSKKLIYFDNNATTLVEPSVKKVFDSWISCFNPSSSHKYAQEAKNMIELVKKDIIKYNNCENYTIIFTSGATESNCFALKSVAEAYKRKTGEMPHIVASSIEHHATIDCLEEMEKDGLAQVSWVAPNIYGQVLSTDVEKLIKSNTCLVCVMYANNETGTINDIPAIGKIAHKHDIPLFSDLVQIYGKFKIDLPKHNIDICSASLHKLYGVKGIGLMIISNKLLKGYEIHPQIFGSQQYGLRGGTENVAGIASIGETLKLAYTNRDAKNKHMRKMLRKIYDTLDKEYGFIDIQDIIGKKYKFGDCKYKLVVIGMPLDHEIVRLPNTLMISIIKLDNKKPFCNVKFKKALENEGVIVSIASACLTSSKNASHVLLAMQLPQIALSGVLRISINDFTTCEEVNTFCKIFRKVLDRM